jgi:predicted nucleic acid-binding protein
LIVLDTTVLVYAVGGAHPLREPSQRLIKVVREHGVAVTTTAHVIEEFVHVRTRRFGRAKAAATGRDYAALLAPLLAVAADDVDHGLGLYERHERLGSFDAVLAATTLRAGHTLVSADRAFADVPGLRHVDPAAPELEELLATR